MGVSILYACDPNPCKNNGRCMPMEAEFEGGPNGWTHACDCASGYHGNECEQSKYHL